MKTGFIYIYKDYFLGPVSEIKMKRAYQSNYDIYTPLKITSDRFDLFSLVHSAWKSCFVDLSGSFSSFNMVILQTYLAASSRSCNECGSREFKFKSKC